MRLPVLTVAALLLAACNQQQPPQPATPAAGTTPAATPAPPPAITPTTDGHFSPDITIPDFAAHVERLASDEFEGRKPGTIGERMATTYLVDQFQRMGLKPGNKGSYLQSVPMVEVALTDGDKLSLDVAVGGNVEKFNFRSDTIVFSPQGKPETEVKDSDMVFAGYGVVAPEYQWNDYAGLDVKGKTVVVLINDPGWGNHDASLVQGRRDDLLRSLDLQARGSRAPGRGCLPDRARNGGRGLSVGRRRQQLERPAVLPAGERGFRSARPGRRLDHDRGGAAPVRQGRRRFRYAEEVRRCARFQADRARGEVVDDAAQLDPQHQFGQRRRAAAGQPALR